MIILEEKQKEHTISISDFDIETLRYVLEASLDSNDIMKRQIKTNIKMMLMTLDKLEA